MQCFCTIVWYEICAMCVCVCRVAAETAQFLLGLGLLGNLISQHPDTCQPLLVSSQTKLTLTQLTRLYAIRWSPVGSNRRNEEEETIFFFEMFLSDCESKLEHVIPADNSISGHTLFISECCDSSPDGSMLLTWLLFVVNDVVHAC